MTKTQRSKKTMVAFQKRDFRSGQVRVLVQIPNQFSTHSLKSMINEPVRDIPAILSVSAFFWDRGSTARRCPQIVLKPLQMDSPGSGNNFLKKIIEKYLFFHFQKIFSRKRKYFLGKINFLEISFFSTENFDFSIELF